VHVWFSEEPMPRDADLEQVAALREFKQTLEPLGLLGTYASPDDLGFKVRQAVEHDLTVLNLGPVAQRRPPASATLRGRYDYERAPHTDNRGRTKLRTRRERITVRNVGTAPAAGVVLTIAPSGMTTHPEADLTSPRRSSPMESTHGRSSRRSGTPARLS
jgi:hypothetical protein